MRLSHMPKAPVNDRPGVWIQVFSNFQSQSFSHDMHYYGMWESRAGEHQGVGWGNKQWLGKARTVPKQKENAKEQGQ